MNRPEVIGGVAPGMERVQAGTFFDTFGNSMYGDERGVAIFHRIADGLVEGHYLLTHELRGTDRMTEMRKWIALLFTNHDAYAIEGNTPRDMLHARCVNRALGFRPIGVSVDSAGRDCIKYTLERSTWAASSAPA